MVCSESFCSDNFVTRPVCELQTVLQCSPKEIRGETVCTDNPPMGLKKMKKSRGARMGGDLLRDHYFIPSQFIHTDYGCGSRIYTSDISRANSLDGSSPCHQCMCSLVWSRTTSKYFTSVLYLNLASLGGTFGQGLCVCSEQVNSFCVTRQSRKLGTRPHKHFIIS